MAFDRLDHTRIGSIAVAQAKAVSAAPYRRSTNAPAWGPQPFTRIGTLRNPRKRARIPRTGAPASA